MKLFIPIAFFTLLTITCQNQKSTTSSNQASNQILVTGKINQKLTYCGGAKPTQEILEGFKIPKPINNFKLYIKKDELNHQDASPIDSTTTGENGTFKFKLPKGNYVLLSELQLSQPKFEENLNQHKLTVTDQNQLDKFFENGLAKFSVTDNSIETLNVIIKQKCDIPEGVLGVKSTTPLRP